MNKVLGKRVYVEMLVDSVWYLIFCAKTAALDLNQDEIEVTSVESEADREFEPGMSDATITCSGITVLDNTEGRISLFYLLQPEVRRNMQTVRMRFIDQDSDTNQVSFTCMIKTLGITKDVVSFSQSTVVFRVSGGLTTGSVPAPSASACEVVDELYIDCVADESSVHSTSLDPEGGYVKTIITCARTGIVHTETTGTPTGTQFLFTTAAGTISTDSANPYIAGEFIYVLYKKTPL